MTAQVFYGTSLKNASHVVTVANSSLKTSVTYNLEATSPALLMLVPESGANVTEFSFSYKATGDTYSWI